jgi:hypothetical protein
LELAFDISLCRQIMFQQLSNAVKHADPGSSIEISFRVKYSSQIYSFMQIEITNSSRNTRLEDWERNLCGLFAFQKAGAA